jgi:hypothetical protein
MRDFEKAGTAHEADTDEGHERVPGKRTLVEGPDPYAPPSGPGKRTLTEALPAAHPMDDLVAALLSELGAPLQEPDKWSAKVGADVGQARIVKGSKAEAAAAALGARAFTVGRRVFFGAGVDATTEGGKILAHELIHVAQQAGAPEPAPEAYAHLPITPTNDSREQAAHRHDATQHLNTGISISKWGDGSSVTWGPFLQTLGLGPLPEMWQRLRILERGPFGKYVATIPLFPEAIGDELFSETVKPQLAALISPEPLGPLIDRARALDYDQPDPDKAPVRSDKGSNKVEDRPVVIEIGNALVRHYYESVTRMFPRVAALMVARNPPSQPGVPSPSWVELREDEVAVSHPMDVVVRKALLANKFGIQRAGVAAIAAKEISADIGDAKMNDKPVKLSFAPEGKLWHWVMADRPDATKEQVAKALFGKPEEAYRLIPMAPLWGFRARDAAGALSNPAYLALVLAVDAARNHPDPSRRPTPDIEDVVDGKFHEPEIDPVTELVKAKGDGYGQEREKQNAMGKRAPAGPAKKVDEANVFQLLQGMLKNLDDLTKLLPLFHLGLASVKEAKARFGKRAEDAAQSCLTDPDSTFSFATTQSGLLTRISIGIGNAAQRLMQVGGAVASDAMREPLNEVASAFVDALAAIEVPELASPRLEQAETLAQNIEIALQEASLHERLGELEGETKENWAKPDPAVTPGEHADKLDDLALQLADARIGMRESPAAAQAKLQAVKPKVDSLGFQIGLSEKLARLNMFWDAMDREQDIWESVTDRVTGELLKTQNRALYARFKKEVYDPFMAADKANDDKGKLAAQQAYNAILTGPQMKEHGETVRKFLQQVAKHKKWSKFIVSLAITFVAFGLGQWEFGAVMAAEGSVFEAAVAGGLVTTTTSVVLNKVVFDQNPTAVGVLTSFAFNVGTFFVIGKLALAAKAAAAEAALVDGAQEVKAAASVAAKTSTAGKAAKAVGNFALGLAKDAVVAEAMGLGQAQVEKAIAKRQLLTEEEVEDIFIQSLIGVVGMRVAHAVVPSDLFQYKPPEQKLATDIQWLKTEQKALSQQAALVAKAAESAPGGKPDKAAVMEVLQRWQKYLEREQQTREKLLEYAEKHPGKFKEADIAKLKAAGTDARLVSQMRTAQAMIAVEPEGVNRFTCAAGALDLVIEQHRASGNEITKVATDPVTGQRTITVKPADGGPAFEITEKVPPKGKRTQARIAVGSARHFEQWLDARELFHVPGQAELRELYLRDPEAAVNFASEKYGYRPESLADTGLLVKPDAPGEANKLPVEPMLSPGEHQLAVKLGHGVVAVGNGRFIAAPNELADMHATWAKQKGANPGKLVYDPDTNTTHFELDVDGKRVRVEAQLASKVYSYEGMAGVSNRVVGGRISEAVGIEILRSVVQGDYEMIAATGIAGPLKAPGELIEFGLGRLHDGGCVVVIGGPHEIDWIALPGIEPSGHTHPSTRFNNLRPGDDQRQAISLDELLDASKTQHLNRHLIFPSGSDFITMAQLSVKGHRVYTPYVVESGVVRKPVAGENLPRLEFTIGESREVGKLASGAHVYEATLQGTAGTETPISNRKVWVIDGQGDSFVELAEPPGLQRDTAKASTKGGGKTKTGLTPEMQRLAAKYGDAPVHWALASVPDSDVEALVTVNEPLRGLLMTVPATDARDVLAIVPEADLSKVLNSGSPVTAEHLARLRRTLGKTAAKEIIDPALKKPDARALSKLARIGENVGDAGSRFAKSDLDADSVVLDSNARSALEECQRGKNKKNVILPTFGDVDDNYKAAVNAIRAARGLAPIPANQALPMTLDQLVGPHADLRTSEVAGAEGIAADKMRGSASATLPALRGVGVNRTHPDYAAVLHDLGSGSEPIGGAEGGADRVIVADTLFANTANGSVPTLVTVDDRVYVRLARQFADPPISWPKPQKGMPDPAFKDKLKLAPEATSGVFMISIRGHKMKVRYM